MQSLNAQEISAMARAHKPPKLEFGPDHDHVFDPFVFQGDRYFYRYMSDCLCWMAMPPLPLEEGQRRSSLHDDDADYADLAKFMPPPAMPSEPFPGSQGAAPKGIFQGPFYYRGRGFVWFISEGLDGWKLATVSEPHAHSASVEATVN